MYLRAGGHEAIDGNSGCAGALKKLLPRVEKAEHADIESWECLADQEQGRLGHILGVSRSVITRLGLTWHLPRLATLHVWVSARSLNSDRDACCRRGGWGCQGAPDAPALPGLAKDPF